MVTAKVFKSGRSQAVRVPVKYRFRSSQVNILATPDGLLLTEKGPWELFQEGVKLSKECGAELEQARIIVETAGQADPAQAEAL